MATVKLNRHTRTVKVMCIRTITMDDVSAFYKLAAMDCIGAPAWDDLDDDLKFELMQDIADEYSLQVKELVSDNDLLYDCGLVAAEDWVSFKFGDAPLENIADIDIDDGDHVDTKIDPESIIIETEDDDVEYEDVVAPGED